MDNHTTTMRNMVDYPNKETPLISIVTVCFNSVKTIKNTIDSLLCQTYKNFEYILIDGGSTDGTVNLIRSYESPFQELGISYKWISEKDSGIYDAMNKGINLSTGNLVALLNSDDWYETKTLENIEEAYFANPEVGVFHGIVKFWKNNKINTLYGTSDFFIDQGIFPPHSTCFIKKSVYNSVGIYDIKFPIASDYDMMLRIKKAGVPFLLIEKVMANFSLHGVSSSRPLSLDIIAIKKKHGLITNRRYRLLSPLYRILNFIYPYLK